MPKDVLTMIDVLIADDSPLFRAGLRTILCAKSGIRIVGEAEDGAQAVAMGRSRRPDVILMDIRMPRMDGIQAVARLKGPGGDEAVKIVILSMFDHDENLFKALRAGACGFLMKESPPETIVEGIHAAHAGDGILSPRATARLIDAFVGTPDVTGRRRRDLSFLTDRERDVLELVVAGLRNEEIAQYLAISPSTVKSHVRKLQEKAACVSRVHLVIFGFEHGIRRRPVS
jgi:DNA-binding NarL/FixJ family response regulator